MARTSSWFWKNASDSMIYFAVRSATPTKPVIVTSLRLTCYDGCRGRWLRTPQPDSTESVGVVAEIRMCGLRRGHNVRVRSGDCNVCDAAPGNLRSRSIHAG